MFKCHGFKVKSTAVAKQLAQEIAVICNQVFKKLRQTRTFVRSQSTTKQPSVSAEGVPLRNKTDPDTRALKRLIAQTRISVTQGADHVDDVSDKDEEEAETMLCGPEPAVPAEAEEGGADFSVVDEIIRQLQMSILAVDAAIEQRGEAPSSSQQQQQQQQQQQEHGAEEDEEDEEVAEVEAEDIDFEEFSDDFARMTLYLHGDTVRNRPMPKYAEVTLDSDLFDLTSMV
ncbi:hypothetical protein PTSG_09932 [Salpingoeca rosetta]|uniref:Uncharacterized protein n=1 Tax=Salpingoeca rosetta (strain ATCC 50818 / BSB-021) TaxID=946362 RepID=F2UNJ8_SALR5|nr:uncharacterized protein PTSG_09932 [Salpingoeca rosetta]EGD79203.1 hypothetical protein PTSG_09932 [Salpingoeca rosetta]|eukprot:XP_004989288.1 hypothetical protein PTSG_09932 [Salpingoeca rosetta]